MLTPYSNSNARRSAYAVFFFLAVLGPVVSAAPGIAGLRAPWVEAVGFFAGILGLPMLCVWCAIYVQHEARRVRFALISIAVLFLIIFGVILSLPNIR